jgi:hypothetical protein
MTIAADGITAVASSPPLLISGTIVDGVQGKTSDFLGATIPFLYGKGDVQDEATMHLSDRSGEFLGPNGNGDPSHVVAQGMVPLHDVDPFTGLGLQGTMTFSTFPVPEPGSLALLSAGAVGLCIAGMIRLKRRPWHRAFSAH